MSGDNVRSGCCRRQHAASVLQLQLFTSLICIGRLPSVRPYPEELGEGAGHHAKVRIDLDQVSEPTGELLAGAGCLEALITHDDGTIILPVPDHPPHGLIDGSALLSWIRDVTHAMTRSCASESGAICMIRVNLQKGHDIGIWGC